MNDSLPQQLKEILATSYNNDAEKFKTDIQAYLSGLDNPNNTNGQYEQPKSGDVILNSPTPKPNSDLNREIIVEVSHVNKIYRMGGNDLKALNDVSLKIAKGEFLAIVGPSGSGKTTLLQLIGGLDKPTSGEIIVNKLLLNKLSSLELSNYRNLTIGFIFQLFYLQPYLTVTENVAIPLMFRNDATDIYNTAQKVVKSVGLEDRSDHLPKQLSGGQMQRVAIARALVGQPLIIIADEPTANLDKHTATEIIKLLRAINNDFKTTVIIVTHDNNVANMADRIINMSNGEII